MDSARRNRLMLQILIGSAWADGHCEAREREELQRILNRYGLTHGQSLLSLLERPVSLRQTEEWIVEYLAESTEEERMQLLGAIGRLLISDEELSAEEHQLLDGFHLLIGTIPVRQEKVLSVIGSLGHLLRKITQIRT